MKHDLPSFALLIDADNVGQESIAPIIEEITRHARVTVRRIYGDFTSTNLAGWKTKLAEHAIHPIQQYRNTIGKNASDSALIIDAMDLLHSRRFEGFCLVSSDSDFTRLATRIREDGLIVYGFGEKKAPKAFVSACDRYIYVENLVADARVEAPSTDAPTEAPVALAATLVAPVATTCASTTEIASPVPSPTAPPIPTIKPPTSAAKLLMKAYANVADDQGWALLGQLSSYIHANHSDFDPRNYGCSKFIDLIQKTAAFELLQRSYKNGQSYFCRPAKGARSNRTSVAASKEAAEQALRKALVEAVTLATALNGWAPLSMIGQRLKSLGHSVEGSGSRTLTEALMTTREFDTCGAGAARYFRLRQATGNGTH